MALTAKQRVQRDDRLIAWIEDFVTSRGYAPSVREIGSAFGLTSTSTTSDWLNRMRRDGRVDWIDGETRTLHVVRS